MNTAIATMKAIMIIWHAAGTYQQTMTTTRFDTVAECKAAKDAILHDNWAAGGSFAYLSPNDIHCIPYKN